jgi:hypothetical protein
VTIGLPVLSCWEPYASSEKECLRLHRGEPAANGDDDIIAPTINSFELARRLPNAQITIFPDSGHGGILQYHTVFVQQALDFLR